MRWWEVFTTVRSPARGARGGDAGGATFLTEVITPRTAATTLGSAESFFAALGGAEPISLEIAASPAERRFLIRAPSERSRELTSSLLGAAYPRAALRRLDTGAEPGLDPARSGADERYLTVRLRLRGPVYLPLRTWRDGELSPGRVEGPAADPLSPILAALGDIPDSWRSLAQLVVAPAPDDWARPYARLAVESPLASERLAAYYRAETSPAGVGLLGAALTIGALYLQATSLYERGDWLSLASLGALVLVGLPVLALVVRRLTRTAVYDPRVIQEKLGREARLTQLRLTVFAPRGTPDAAVSSRLRSLAAAYREFGRASGNALLPERVRSGEVGITRAALLPSTRAGLVLNSAELAGLWHLPLSPGETSFIAQNGPRRLLPRLASVGSGFRIGVAAHQNSHLPVALPPEILSRHQLLVAKTRRGKSSLLLRFFAHLVADAGPAPARPFVLLVDPHQDLALASLGLVPASRRPDVVCLSLSEGDRPFGLNLLDTGLGWDRGRVVANTLAVFRREFDRFWGPRMEDAFRFALLTLFEANEAIAGADGAGRERQYTILDVPPLLTDTAFRRQVLQLVRDPTVRGWWTRYFASLDRRLQLEVVNPVQTKVQRFAGDRLARAIVGQPRSTIDPAGWLREGRVVIVNTAKGLVGEDTAALIGGTIINLVGLLIAEQARLPAEERRRAHLIVDEFQTMPGADFESVLAEHAKYGASLTLATQSLARLDALDRESHRALRPLVFANLDALFAFQVSADDARYLARELGSGIEEADLLELPDHECYVRVSVGGERLAAFSVRLDPPPRSDPAIARALLADSAERIGRDLASVEAGLRSASARIELAREAEVAGGSGEGGGSPGGAQSAAPDDPTDRTDSGATPGKGARNEHRARLTAEPSIAWMQSLLERAQQSPEGRDLDLRIEGGVVVLNPGDTPEHLPQRIALLDRLIAGTNGPGDAGGPRLTAKDGQADSSLTPSQPDEGGKR
jgi:hypothetical protein